MILLMVQFLMVVGVLNLVFYEYRVVKTTKDVDLMGRYIELLRRRK